MDADAAAGEFHAVRREIVGLREDAAKVAARGETVHVVVSGRGKRVVLGLPSLVLLVPFKEREVGDDAQGEHGGVGEAEALADMQPQLAQDRRHLGPRARRDQQQIAGDGGWRLPQSP